MSAKNKKSGTEEKEPISISEAEWQVMERLWESAPMGSQELAAELGTRQGWARTTVVTLLQRLVKKGAVRAEARGAKSVYVPAVERMTCATAEASSLLDRLFGGALHPLVAHFARNDKLTAKDVTELRALLDEIDAGRKKKK